MARGKTSLLALAVLFIGVVVIRKSQHAFAQGTARQYRMAQGTAHKPVADHDVVLMAGLTASEKRLMSQMSDASRGQNWQQVESLWSGYSGQSFPVACAAMQAAINCEHYRDAAKMHQKLWGRNPRPNSSVPYTLGIKIFAKLGQNETVQSIWTEAISRDLVDEFVAGSQIDASADFGNVTAAAEALEYMVRQNFSIGADRFCSAINACKNSDYLLRHRAAMFLFKQMISRGLQPDAAVFGSLLGAHSVANLTDILDVWQLMNKYGVRPNQIVAETCLTAILGRFQSGTTLGVKGLVSELQNRSAKRRVAARDVLAAVLQSTRLLDVILA